MKSTNGKQQSSTRMNKAANECCEWLLLEFSLHDCFAGTLINKLLERIENKFENGQWVASIGHPSCTYLPWRIVHQSPRLRWVAPSNSIKKHFKSLLSSHRKKNRSPAGIILVFSLVLFLQIYIKSANDFSGAPHHRRVCVFAILAFVCTYLMRINLMLTI